MKEFLLRRRNCKPKCRWRGLRLSGHGIVVVSVALHSLCSRCTSTTILPSMEHRRRCVQRVSGRSGRHELDKSFDIWSSSCSVYFPRHTTSADFESGFMDGSPKGLGSPSSTASGVVRTTSVVGCDSRRDKYVPGCALENLRKVGGENVFRVCGKTVWVTRPEP